VIEPPRPDFETRRETLRAALSREGLRALGVSAEPNVGYLTGFTGDSSILVVTSDRAVLLSDGRYTDQIAQECPGLEAEIRPVSGRYWDFLGGFLKGLGFAAVALEGDAITIAGLEQLAAAAPALEWQPTSGLVENLRMVKDDWEVWAIRRSIRIAESAFTSWLEKLDPSWSEKQAADELDSGMRRAGSAASSFPVIVASGDHSALPHARPRHDIAIGSVDALLVDWGADGGPYKSDLTRVLGTSSLSATFETVYRTVLAAQERAIDVIRPGVTGETVDRAARARIEQAGFGPQFGHGAGHGIGRQIHEAPFLRSTTTAQLQPWMVVTVEPGIYLPGWGGIRIEDDVLVTPDGCEVLTSIPRSLEWSRGGWRGGAGPRNARTDR
jgi:Xaa-Pro aminopeptidase